ncbi:hypothetical protein L7F22_056209 [Adiantum nelumboides]|nr:hypothetical protein [Adiantum nelumboides]
MMPFRDVSEDEGMQPVNSSEVEMDHHARSFTKLHCIDGHSHPVIRESPKINRWMGLSAAMIMMGCNGLTYTYAVYSEYIKKQLHYSQERTDDLGAAKDFGSFFGAVSGLCYFLFPPWVSVLIGGLMHFLGYTMILFTLTGRIKESFWFLCFSSAVATGGDNFVDTACIMIILESFKGNKGTAVGILKSQLGLSAAIFVTVYEAFLESKVVNFLSLITIVPSVVYCGLAFLIRPYPCKEEETDQSDVNQRFRLVSIIVISLGIFLMAVMTLEEAFDLKDMAEKFFATSMLLIMGAMLVVPLMEKPLERLSGAVAIVLPGVSALDKVGLHKNASKIDSDEEMDGEGVPLRPLQGASLEPGDPVSKEDEVPYAESGVQEDPDTQFPSVWQNLLGVNFWLITFVVASGAGSGLAIMNNFAQIGKAVRSDGIDAFVGIISIWSCFGRLVSGYGSDLMLEAGYSRPVCLLISQIAMFICCLLLSTGSTLFLFIGSAVVGLAYGSYWTLAPTIIAEVFGLRQVATLYKLLGLGPTICSYVLSAKVMGYLYDKESLYYQKQHAEVVEENACYGRRCFEFGLLSLASVCFVGVVACAWFAYRTKKFYSRLGHARLTNFK